MPNSSVYSSKQAHGCTPQLKHKTTSCHCKALTIIHYWYLGKGGIGSERYKRYESWTIIYIVLHLSAS